MTLLPAKNLEKKEETKNDVGQCEEAFLEFSNITMCKKAWGPVRLS